MAATTTDPEISDPRRSVGPIKPLTDPDWKRPTRAQRALGYVVDRTYLLVTLAFILGALLLWEWMTDSGILHAIVVPGPAEVWDRFLAILPESYFHTHLWVTVKEILIGFAVGASSGIATALVCLRFPLFRRVVTPYMVSLQALPKIVLLPLFYVWFGVGPTSATLIVILVTFFPVYINTITGMAIVDENGLRLLHSLGATPRQAFKMYRVPSALPLIFTGLKTAVNFGVTAAIAAELLGSRYGLGFMIVNSGTFLRIADLYATVAVVALFAAIVYFIFEMLDRKLIFWREDRPGSKRRH
jgi:NitT/TauT family transport system permease protein